MDQNETDNTVLEYFPVLYTQHWFNAGINPFAGPFFMILFITSFGTDDLTVCSVATGKSTSKCQSVTVGWNQDRLYGFTPK